MSIERAGPSNAREASSVVNSSFNTSIRNAEGSHNNIYNINNNVTFKIDKQSRKNQKKDLPTIKERNDQQEVLPNQLPTIEDKNELILKWIWKYLNIMDKFNCTLVCKRFNKFIIEMDYFCLHLHKSWPLFKMLPTFKRSYKTLLIKDHYFENFSPTLQRMLQQLSGSLISITLHRVATDVITFRDILDELPLLESFELFEIQFQGFKASFVGTPKFGRLRNLKINVRRPSLVTWFSNSATANALLDIFSYAPKVTTLSIQNYKMRCLMVLLFVLLTVVLISGSPIDDSDDESSSLELHPRFRRATCDLFKSEPLCKAHCLLKKKLHGHCNRKGVCVCS
ncbi:unnamed protein product [Diamesa hyperborea]